MSAKIDALESEKQKLIDIEKAKSDKLQAELQAKKDAELTAEQQPLRVSL
jgi:hypothetical protein